MPVSYLLLVAESRFFHPAPHTIHAKDIKKNPHKTHN